MPQIIPIKELKNTSEISEMCHRTEEPIYITKNGWKKKWNDIMHSSKK